MLNGFGQTQIDPRYIAEQLKQHPTRIHSGWEAGARALAVALGAHNAQTSANEQKATRQSALADALAGLNGGALTGEGPTADAAGRAPIGDPQLMARLLSDPNTAQVGQALLGRALQPAPGRYEDVLGPEGRPIAQRNSVTGKVEPYPKNPYAQDPYNLSPGQQRFDGQDNLIASVPPKPRELSPRDEAFTRLTPEQQVQALLKPNNEINLGPQETEEAKKFGGLLVSRYENVLNEADAAQAQLSVIQQARALNETALPSQLKLTAGNVMQSIGINPESVPGFEFVSNGQQFNAVMEQAVLSAMQAQKGPQTEADQRRIKSTVANIGNTAKAREFLLDSAEAMNTMKTMKAEFWRNYRAGKGTLAGAEKAWSDTFGDAGLVRRWESDGVSGVFFFPQWYAEARNHPDNADLSDAEILELWKSYE